MGFSLVGNSGDQSTTSNIYETSYSASLNPQLDLQGSGAGASAIDLSPLLQGSTISTYNPSVQDSYAPINIVTAGALTGDSAIAGFNALAASTAGAAQAAGSPTASGASSSLSSLLSGNGIYWIIGAIALFFLSEK